MTKGSKNWLLDQGKWTFDKEPTAAEVEADKAGPCELQGYKHHRFQSRMWQEKPLIMCSGNDTHGPHRLLNHDKLPIVGAYVQPQAPPTVEQSNAMYEKGLTNYHVCLCGNVCYKQKAYVHPSPVNW